MAAGVGIDLGTTSIKVVDLRISEKGGAVIRRALYYDKAALAARGVDIADRRKVAELLKQEMGAAGIPTRDVALAISGKESIIRYTHVPPVPAWRLKIIMDYEVGEVSEKIGEKLSSDYRILPVTREADDEHSIIIGLVKEPALEALLGDLSAVGITVRKAIPASIALYAAYSAFGKKPDLESPDDELVVVVDIGSENLDLAFLLNGNLVFARSASFGGRNFTEALSRDLSLDPERAETLKLRGGTLEAGGGGRREETVSPLRAAAAQLLSMIQSSLKFCRSQVGAALPEPNRYVILGGGAALNGLTSYLQAGLQKPVEVFHPSVAPSSEVAGEAAKVLSATPGNFAVALGLAAAVVRRDGFELSMLPRRYLERRQFRERTLYMYLAAGFLFVFLAARLAQGITETSSANATKKYLQETKQTFERIEGEMNANAAQNAQSRERINRILREAEVVPFQAFALDFLAAHVGAEMKLTALKLQFDSDEEGNPSYQLLVDGAADNASQRALRRIEDLRAAFAAESRVASVEVASTRQAGNWYEFRLVVTPSYPAQR